MSVANSAARIINSLLRPFDIKISRLSASINHIPTQIDSTAVVERAITAAPNQIEIREVEIPFSPDTWVMIETKYDANLWIDLGDVGVSRACMKETFEVMETNFVRSFLKKGDTFLDIGANIGWFTIVAAQCVGDEGVIHAFEPRNTTFKYLEKTIAINGLEQRIFAHHCALGAESGKLRIVWGTQTSNPGGTWLVSRKAVSDMLPTTTHSYQDIDVRRLDDFEQIQQVQLMKIDVEGAEPLVLKGSTELLRRSRPVILSEINEELLRIVGNSSSVELIDWMQTMGYDCFELTTNGLGQQLGRTNGAFPAIVNVLFVPSEFDRSKLRY
ncbi:FkbM family methyltransferase [Undibacterium cyanobacteriorum]|uniref:FkbM family methyltransferase n=1 Tax=Undibacterium cyanobacteriorum TaxID=3073561 RepID=A0ABY9RJV4_9BURK|nr:FkbM family methyltransferase [Undibacterium sp. 20NA77.5]WMW80545.1 FkbM family methyltransferase [Undibacterium sp. 20NA77.5]